MPDNEPTAAPEQSLGDDLRKQREIRGISLKEIADSTKIGKRYLELIEKGEYSGLPAPVFTRGFIREYARYLGLNADEMVDRYLHTLQTTEEEPLPEVHQKPVVRPRPTSKQIGLPRSYHWMNRNIVLTVLLVVAVAAAGWWAYARSRAAKNEVAEQQTATIPPPQPAVKTKPAPPPVPPPSASGELTLQLKVTENSWIDLDADGKRVISDELRRGDQRSLTAKNEFRFRTIGNAGGVELTLNGVSIPPLGASGKVLHDRIYNRQKLDELTHPGNP